jgi:P-type Cu+ transporter
VSCLQVAIEAADFVLNRSELDDVVMALDLARAAFRRILINYVWAMLYNVLMIPVAAGVFFPWTHVQLRPMFAGLAMAMSSVSVVLSSLQLTWYRRPQAVLRDRVDDWL